MHPGNHCVSNCCTWVVQGKLLHNCNLCCFFSPSGCWGTTLWSAPVTFTGCSSGSTANEATQTIRCWRVSPKTRKFHLSHWWSITAVSSLYTTEHKSHKRQTANRMEIRNFRHCLKVDIFYRVTEKSLFFLFVISFCCRRTSNEQNYFSCFHSFLSRSCGEP